MKNRQIAHWSRDKGFEGLLLFAQALEEGTFHYSYESYKIPALNCHYLCYDIMRTANDINKKILMDGNFVPLAEEFEQMISEDLFIKSNIDSAGTLLYTRDRNAKYHNLLNDDLKSKIKHYPEIASFVKDICEANNFYLSELLNVVLDNIFTDNYSYKNGDAVYRASRMFITDLVNSGYSKEYIYFTVLDFFFNPLKPVECSPETVTALFNCFTFEEYGYRATFGINKKARHIFSKIEYLTVREPTKREQQQFNLYKRDDCVVSLNVKAIDVYSAFESAIGYINTILALHKISQHDTKLFISSKAVLEKICDDDTYEKGILIQSPPNPMKKKGNSSDIHAIFYDISLLNEIDPPVSFFRAIALHSGATETRNISNQLLNLWTIIETLIDAKRDNEDKINTICATLCAVLNRVYLYSNINQLLCDVKACASCDIEEIINKPSYSNEDMDSVEKFALLLSLKDNSQYLTEIMNSLIDFPLLQYRINYFSNYIFVDSKSIYEYLHRHEKRIRWQIMRIYRNRNMIVHSGASMPYRNMIVENLHFYVDVLLDTLIEYYHLGLLSHSSIYESISNQQITYYVSLGIPIDNKGKQTAIPINKDNALQLIFNGYSGNPIKKALDSAINRNRVNHSMTSIPEKTDTSSELL